MLRFSVFSNQHFHHQIKINNLKHKRWVRFCIYYYRSGQAVSYFLFMPEFLQLTLIHRILTYLIGYVTEHVQSSYRVETESSKDKD